MTFEGHLGTAINGFIQHEVIYNGRIPFFLLSYSIVVSRIEFGNYYHKGGPYSEGE